MIRIFERMAITQHSLKSVVKGDTTGGGVLTIADPSANEINSFSGILREIKVSCDSTDFDVRIKSSPTDPDTSINRVYTKDTGNLFVHENSLYNAWINDKPTRASELYITVINKDIVRDTGIITVQLTNMLQKRWRNGK